MQLVVEVNTSVTLYAKRTLQELKLDNNIRKVYNEEDETFKQVVAEFENQTGTKREQNKDSFDKELLAKIAKDAKEEETKRLDKIMDVIAQCYTGKKGYVTICGCVINPNEFCAIKINNIEFKCSKH